MTQTQSANPGIDADIRTFAESVYAQQTDSLRELVKVPPDNPSDDCTPHAVRVEVPLEALGLMIEAYAVPQAQMRVVGMVSATNLIVRHTFDNGNPAVAMDAYGNVVPPGLGWMHDPYGGEIVETEHGPTMFGRGVAVPKSDLAIYMWALLVLTEARRRGVKLNGTVELRFTCDEETGGDIGPKWLLDQGLSKPDYTISVGSAYGVTSTHSGRLHVEVTARDK